MSTLKKIVYLLIFIVIIIINHYLSRFGIYGSNGYFSFLLENGPFISLGFAFIGVVWKDLDSNIDLISSNPVHYVRGYFLIFATMLATISDVFYALASNIKQQDKEKKAPYGEGLFAALISFFFITIILIWSLVIAVPLYFVNLIVGAPARLVKRDQKRFSVTAVDKTTEEEIKELSNFFKQRPVTATSTILIPLLWLLKVIVF